jgi:hypothetical protein
LALVFALVAPSESDDALAQAVLSSFVEESRAPDATAEKRSRAALYLGLFHALGRPLSPALQAKLGETVSPNLPGRRPTAASLMRIEAAAAADRRGETVLALLEAMGPAGPVGIAPDVTVRFVQVLQSLGLREPARMLAVEAITVPAPSAQG